MPLTSSPCNCTPKQPSIYPTIDAPPTTLWNTPASPKAFPHAPSNPFIRRIQAHMAFADGVKALVDSGIKTLPEAFVFPEHQRPDASSASSAPRPLPLIDLAELDGARRLQTVRRIVEASHEWGFFQVDLPSIQSYPIFSAPAIIRYRRVIVWVQVVNHGVDPAVMDGMLKSAGGFHELPAEEKMKYLAEDAQKSRFRPGVSDNIVGSAAVGWMDQFYMYSESSDDWPPVCREAALEYWGCVRRTAERILGALSEGLGMAADFLQKSMLMDRPLLALKYYPRCPDPSLTLGLGAHSDPTALTIVLQDRVGGLQVFKEGAGWVGVDPLPGAFVVNVGDLLEIVSNGRFRSAEHRVLANARVGRLSVAAFFGPRSDAKIAPVVCPADADGGQVQVSRFRECVYGDYVRHFHGRTLDGKSSLDFARAG